MRRTFVTAVAAAILAATFAAAPQASAQAEAQGYGTEFGCKQALLYFTDGRKVSEATLNFTDGTSEMLPSTGEARESAGGRGMEGNHDKNIASITVVTTTGETITAANPLDCSEPTVFPYTTSKDGFDITFTACETVTVTSSSGVTVLRISGTKPRVPDAVADVTSDTPVSSLTATLEDPGTIMSVFALGPSGGISIYSPLGDCVGHVVGFRPSGEDNPSIAPIDTCYSAELVFNKIRVSSATATFSDGSSVTETYGEPVFRVFFEAPANTRPVKISYEAEAFVGGEWIPMLGGETELYKVCESTTGETIRVVDDVARPGETVAVLDNDTPSPGAVLRPESLQVISSDGATVTVADGTLSITDVQGAGARVTYQVCDTFNSCGTATVVVTAADTVPASPQPLEPALTDDSDSTVEVRTVLAISLMVILVGLVPVLLWFRRKPVPGGDAEDEQESI